jgi:hypothetical protein
MLREVQVQPSASDDELVVVSEKPGLAGEILRLDVFQNGDAVGFTVRMTESQPLVCDTAIRHRLRLAVLTRCERSAHGPMGYSHSPPSRNGQLGSLGARFTHSDLFGVLGREVPVQLLNIGRGGCLLESSLRVEDGTTGEVRLGSRYARYHDDIRITRCVALEGAGSVYLMGAEFLWTRHPDKHSLRRAIRRLQRGPIGAR